MVSDNEFYKYRIKKIMESKINRKQSTFTIYGVVVRFLSVVAGVLAFAILFAAIIPMMLLYILSGVDYVSRYMKWCEKNIFNR